MFSGIVQETAPVVVKAPNQIGLAVRGKAGKLGDSVAIDGVCLTISKISAKSRKTVLLFDLSSETRSKTTLDDIRPGTRVNVERALKASDALGGHIVQGHVDGTAAVTSIERISNGKVIWFSASPSIVKFFVSKGSVTINGVSLTVVGLKKKKFSVSLIPYTLSHTNLGELKVGDFVNVEVDILAKYVALSTKHR